MIDEKNLKRDDQGRWRIDFRYKGRRIIRVVGPSKPERALSDGQDLGSFFGNGE